MERRRPRFTVNRSRELPLNLLALAIVILFGEQAKRLAVFVLKTLNIADALAPFTLLSALPGAVKILLAVVFTDFSLYWIHRAMHQRLLWPTHSFHHSIGEIWWLSGSRTSFTHLCLFALPQIFIGYYLLNLSVLQLSAAFSIGVVVNIWIHANIRVNLGAAEQALITPNYHRVHHGARGLTNKNLGFVFTVWDRLFGTYVSAQTTEKDFPIFAVPTQKRLLRMIAGI